jgi:WD40-like Beta Propeller Repeat
VPLRTLHRHGTIEARVAGLVDLAHPARTDGGENFVRTEARTSGKWHHLLSRHALLQFFEPVEHESNLCVRSQNMGPRVNSAADDSLPFLSSNEHVLYFYSTRPAGSSGAPGPGDITRRRNKHSDWGEPTNLGCVLNTPADEIAPAFFNDPESGQSWLFYGSNRVVSGVSIGDYDVYASPLGKHGSAGPGILVPEFSSPGRDTRIFIRKDGLEAFITSNRAGGQGGIDIWTSTRETSSEPWSVPINLGFPVESSSDDGSPWLSKHGTTLYFFSNRPGGIGLRDIWYTTRAKLND